MPQQLFNLTRVGNKNARTLPFPTSKESETVLSQNDIEPKNSKESTPSSETTSSSEVSSIDADDSLTKARDLQARIHSFDDIRNLPMSLQDKRIIRSQFVLQLTTQRKKLSFFAEKRNIIIYHLKTAVLEMLSIVDKLAIWKKPLLKVGCKFGNATKSYFLFIRWLMITNLFVAMIIYFNISGELTRAYRMRNGDGKMEDVYPYTLIWSNSSIVDFEEIGVMTFSDGNRRLINRTCYKESNDLTPLEINTIYSSLASWFNAEGDIIHTTMFYGYHQPVVKENQLYFGFKYLITFISIFALIFYLIIDRAMKGFAQMKVKTSSMQCSYVNNVFAGWDFSISFKEAAELRHESILGVLLEDIDADEKKERLLEKTLFGKIILYTKRTIIWAIVIGFMLGGVFLISKAVMLKNVGGRNPDVNNFFFQILIRLGLMSILPQLTLVAVTSTAPILFKLLVKIEEYSDEKAFQITILRTSLVRLFAIFMLVMALIVKLQCRLDLPARLVSFINAERTLPDDSCLTCTWWSF